MGKIVVTEFVSLDGVMEDPGGAEGFEHGGWTFEIIARRGGRPVQARRARRGRGPAARPRHLRRLRRGLAEDDRRGRLRREDELDAQVRLLLDPDQRRVEQLDDPLRRLRHRDRQAQGRRSTASSSSPAAPSWSRAWSSTISSTRLRLMVFPVLLGSGKRLFGEHADKKPLRPDRLEIRRRRRRAADLRTGIVGDQLQFLFGHLDQVQILTFII